MTKMTYVDALNTVLTSATLSDEVSEKLTALRDQLVKRNSADHKPTKTQKENDGVKMTLLAAMANGEAHTITEWQDAIPELSELSNQKVSALMTQLVKDGKVTKTTDKRKSYFALTMGK